MNLWMTLIMVSTTRTRRRSHQSRQMQIVRLLKNEYGLSVKQIARRLKVSQRSVRRYLPILLEHDIVIVNFRAQEKGTKPTNFYAVKNYG